MNSHKPAPCLAVNAILPSEDRSGDLGNTGGFYHGRPALALGEARCFVLVGVHASKFLAIGVINADQPMMMFAAAVPGEGIFIFVRSFFCHFARPSL
jgi:hypothetical protein